MQCLSLTGYVIWLTQCNGKRWFSRTADVTRGYTSDNFFAVSVFEVSLMVFKRCEYGKTWICGEMWYVLENKLVL